MRLRISSLQSQFLPVTDHMKLTLFATYICCLPSLWIPQGSNISLVFLLKSRNRLPIALTASRLLSAITNRISFWAIKSGVISIIYLTSLLSPALNETQHGVILFAYSCDVSIIYLTVGVCGPALHGNIFLFLIPPSISGRPVSRSTYGSILPRIILNRTLLLA